MDAASSSALASSLSSPEAKAAELQALSLWREEEEEAFPSCRQTRPSAPKRRRHGGGRLTFVAQLVSALLLAFLTLECSKVLSPSSVPSLRGDALGPRRLSEERPPSDRRRHAVSASGGEEGRDASQTSAREARRREREGEGRRQGIQAGFAGASQCVEEAVDALAGEGSGSFLHHLHSLLRAVERPGPGWGARGQRPQLPSRTPDESAGSPSLLDDPGEGGSRKGAQGQLQHQLPLSAQLARHHFQHRARPSTEAFLRAWKRAAAYTPQAARPSALLQVRPSVSEEREGRARKGDSPASTAGAQLQQLWRVWRNETRRIANVRAGAVDTVTSPFDTDSEDLERRVLFARRSSRKSSSQGLPQEGRMHLGGSGWPFSLRALERKGLSSLASDAASTSASEAEGRRACGRDPGAARGSDVSWEAEMQALANVPETPEESSMAINVWVFSPGFFGSVKNMKVVAEAIEEIEALLAEPSLASGDCAILLQRTRSLLERTLPLRQLPAYRVDGWRKGRRLAFLLRAVDCIFRVASLLPSITRSNEWFCHWIDFLNVPAMLQTPPARKSLDNEFFWRRCANLILAYKSGYRTTPRELLRIRRIYEEKYREKRRRNPPDAEDARRR